MIFRAFSCLLALLVVLALATEVWCPKQAAAETLKIGAISVLSGEGAAWGINHQRGTLLAVEEINRRGGIHGKQVEVTFEDSPSGIGKNAVSAYRKLVDVHGVRVILGPLTGDELLAISPMTLRDGVFLVGATYMPELPENFFATWIDPDVEAQLIARRIYSRHQRLAILGSQQSWESRVAQRVATEFKDIGGQVVAFEEPAADAQDVKTEVLRALRKQPEAVFISSYYLLARYAREISRLNQSVPIFSIELDQSAVSECGPSAERLVFIGPKPPPNGFIAEFQKRWSATPDVPAAHSYDAAMVLFQALSTTTGDYAALLKFFSTLQGYDGITGRIDRQALHTAERTAWYIVRAGQILPEPLTH